MKRIQKIMAAGALAAGASLGYLGYVNINKDHQNTETPVSRLFSNIKDYTLGDQIRKQPLIRCNGQKYGIDYFAKNSDIESNKLGKGYDAILFFGKYDIEPIISERAENIRTGIIPLTKIVVRKDFMNRLEQDENLRSDFESRLPKDAKYTIMSKKEEEIRF